MHATLHDRWMQLSLFLINSNISKRVEAVEFARIDSAMAAVAPALLFAAIVVCASVVMAATAAADGEAAAAAGVVVGQAKCGDCARKNMKAQDAFKGLQVAIKCKNGDGEYESKAVGDLDGDGAFSVPLAADDLHDAADCFAQLHSATSSTPCPGQEPSKIVPLSTADNNGGEASTFVAVAGKRMRYSSSAECTSAFLCDYFHRHPFFDYFHKKPQGPGPKPTPTPANGGGAGNGGGGAAPSPSPRAYH